MSNWYYDKITEILAPYRKAVWWDTDLSSLLYNALGKSMEKIQELEKRIEVLEKAAKVPTPEPTPVEPTPTEPSAEEPKPKAESISKKKK